MADISPTQTNIVEENDDNIVEPLTTANDPNEKINNILPTASSTTPLREELPPKVPTWKLIWEEIRPGYILDHFDYASFKVIVRSWLAMWIGDLLAVIHVVHVWLENAPYIMPIIGCIVAPGGQPFIFVLITNFLCGLFMIYGWTYAVIASAITVRMRGFPTATTTVVGLVEEGICQNDQTLLECAQLHLFEGNYLELKYSVIYIFAMLIGLFTLAWAKQLSPLLIAPFTVGVISLCVNISFGVLVPYFADRTIGYIILKPVGLQLCLNIVLGAIIFPFTANFAFFGGLLKLLGPLSQLSKQNIKFLKEIRPSQPEFIQHTDIGRTTAAVLSKSTPVNLMASLSRLEISYGRFDAGDIGELRSLFKNMVSSMAGLEWFFSRVQERKDVLTDKVVPLRTRASTVGSVAPENPTKLYEALHQKYRPVGEFETQRRLQIIQNPSDSDTNQILSLEDLDKLIDLVDKRFSNILLSADRALDCLIDWIKVANEFRVYSRLIPGSYKKHQEAQAKQYELVKQVHQELLSELKTLDANRWHELFRVEDEVGPLVAAFIAQGALFGFAVQRFCTILTRIFDVCEYLDKSRPVPELILPFKKTSKAKLRFDHSLMTADQDASNPDTFPGFVPYDSTQPRDPDASPPRNVGHLIGRRAVRIYSVIFKDNFIFALRTAVIGVIATIPAFVRSTALFYYGNRLIWVVIMTCISTSDMPGDVIKAYIQKMIYTFLACLFGMVAWYISTGSGQGNPYGFAVVNIFVVYILVCYRHFSKHSLPMAAIVLGASTELVLGTSWQNGQIPSPGTHGTGFRIAWIRFVTVSIGITLGFLASCFPRPKTGKAAVRNILAKGLRNIGNIHCDIGKFGVERLNDPNVHRLPRNDIIADRISSVLVKLSSVYPLMKTLKYEPELTGPWPREKYQRLIRLNTDIVQLAFGLYIVIDQVSNPERWMDVIASRCGWTNSDMMTSFFAIIHMASLSLATGGPLPRVSPAQLTLRHLKLLEENYNLSVDSLVRKIILELDELRAGGNIDENPRDPDDESEDRLVSNFGNLLSHDGQLCIVALLFSRMMYERLDELLIVVKGLVGEEFDYNPEFATDLEDVYEHTKLLI